MLSSKSEVIMKLWQIKHLEHIVVTCAINKIMRTWSVLVSMVHPLVILWSKQINNRKGKKVLSSRPFWGICLNLNSEQLICHHKKCCKRQCLLEMEMTQLSHDCFLVLNGFLKSSCLACSQEPHASFLMRMTITSRLYSMMKQHSLILQNSLGRYWIVNKL